MSACVLFFIRYSNLTTVLYVPLHVYRTGKHTGNYFFLFFIFIFYFLFFIFYFFILFYLFIFLFIYLFIYLYFQYWVCVYGLCPFASLRIVNKVGSLILKKKKKKKKKTGNCGLRILRRSRQARRRYGPVER